MTSLHVLAAARDAFDNGEGGLVDGLMRALLAGGGRDVGGAVIREDLGDIRCVEETPDPTRPGQHAPCWQSFIAVAKPDDIYLPDSPQYLYFFRTSRGKNNLNSLGDLQAQYTEWVAQGRPYSPPIISGRVVDKRGDGWMHVTMDLGGHSIDGTVVAAATLTDEHGQFEFLNLPVSDADGYLIQPREYYVTGERFNPLRATVPFPGSPQVIFAEILGKGLGNERIQPGIPLKMITGIVVNADGVTPTVGIPVELHKAAGDRYREDLKAYTDRHGRFMFRYLLPRDRESGAAGESVNYTIYVRYATTERQAINNVTSSSPDVIRMDGTDYPAFVMK